MTRLRALIILPTRDLVMQVRETMEELARGSGLKVRSMRMSTASPDSLAHAVNNPDRSVPQPGSIRSRKNRPHWSEIPRTSERDSPMSSATIPNRCFTLQATGWLFQSRHPRRHTWKADGPLERYTKLFATTSSILGESVCDIYHLAFRAYRSLFASRIRSLMKPIDC